ncbi:MAG: hypothetical protein AAGU11_13220 [Syntrophobacteraceae bacterium]
MIENHRLILRSFVSVIEVLNECVVLQGMEVLYNNHREREIPWNSRQDNPQSVEPSGG